MIFRKVGNKYVDELVYIFGLLHQKIDYILIYQSSHLILYFCSINIFNYYMRQILLCIFIFLFSSTYSQYENHSYLNDLQSDTLSKGDFSIRLTNNNFIKNNEYFTPLTLGYTFFGADVQPELIIALSRNARFAAGWYFQRFFGMDSFAQSLPVIRFDFDINPRLRLTMGQIHGRLNHQLIEPLFSMDNYFRRKHENGFQLLYKSARLQNDFWINWEKFLVMNTNGKEQFTMGNVLFYKIVAKDNFSLGTNFQFTAQHIGGQVANGYNPPLQTLIIFSPGLEFMMKLKNKVLSEIIINSWYLTSKDASDSMYIPYTKGWGLYNSILLRNKNFKFMCAWWKGESYFSPLGEYLFQSISEIYGSYHDKQRYLLSTKCIYEYQIDNGLKLGCRFDTYTDLESRKFDFFYGVNVMAEAEWLYRKKK
jgi:hypothetical protein